MFTNHGPTAAGPSRIARSIPTPSGLSAAVAVGAQWWVCRSAHAAIQAQNVHTPGYTGTGLLPNGFVLASGAFPPHGLTTRRMA